jgi:hypothetical protein
VLLISLMGEQPIPNLLPLWQFSEFTLTRFAATESTLARADMLKATIARDAVLSRRVRSLDTLPLEAYDMQKDRFVLTRAISEHQENGEEICLNLTGGTKIMSLAALQAAFGTGITLMYVSTEENQVIFYRSDATEFRREPIRVKISVQQYLEAHGLETSADPNFRPGGPYADLPPKAGDALEKKVTKCALDSGLFDDVRSNLFIRKQSKLGPVKNELDVVIIRNGRLAVCSCKDTREITKDHLYELSSLSRREFAGIYCGKVLVTTAAVTDAQVERAREAGIFLVTGDQIRNIDFYLKQATE